MLLPHWRFYRKVPKLSTFYQTAPMSNTLRIATRKSALAMWQAEHVASRLQAIHPNLTVELVGMMTRGDIILDTPLAKAFGVAGQHSPFPKSFHFGWATSHADQNSLSGYQVSNHQDMSHWGGYALTQGFFYPSEKAYMIICPQLMVTTPGAFAFGQALIRDASMARFHNVWS